MEIVRIVGIGIVASVMALTVRQQKPEMALLISISTGVLIFLYIAGKLAATVKLLERMVRQADIEEIYLSTVLKVIGIAYITEFGAQACRDAGESAIASKIELAGKIIIILFAVPVIAALLEIILQVLP